MAEFIWLFVALGLLILGILAGGANERAHFRRLDRNEGRLEYIRICNLKRVSNPETVSSSRMVMGQVVIATDSFKSWLTGLRNLVGGEMKAARSLMIRARREAVVRMMEEAATLGATEIWNARFGFCSISMMRGRGGAMQVEVVAWGTAVSRA
jgi:uncharacterized protein YbjQ (UPF0145 family)